MTNELSFSHEPSIYFKDADKLVERIVGYKNYDEFWEKEKDRINKYMNLPHCITENVHSRVISVMNNFHTLNPHYRYSKEKNDYTEIISEFVRVTQELKIDLKTLFELDTPDPLELRYEQILKLSQKEAILYTNMLRKKGITEKRMQSVQKILFPVFQRMLMKYKIDKLIKGISV